MNIGFSGVVVESTVLLQDTDDDTMVIVGVIGLCLTLVYIALTFYISYWGLRGSTDGQTIFDVIESEEMKKIKMQHKKTKKKKLAKKSEDDESHSQRRSTRIVPVEEKNVTSSEDDSSDDDDDIEDGHRWMSRRKSLVSSQSTTARNSSTTNRRNTAARNRRTASTTRNPRSRNNNKKTSIPESGSKSTKEEQSALQQETSFSPSSSSRSSSRHVLSAIIDRRNSMVRMPNDNEDNINEEHSKKEANNESSDNSNNNNNAEVTTSSDSDSTSSSSTFSRKTSSSSTAMRRNKANPLRGPVGSSRRRFNRSELTDTSSSEEISSSSSDEGDEESFEEEENEQNDQQQKEEVMMRILEEDKPPHYVKYGRAMEHFLPIFGACSRFILPDGWWIKFRLYNRRYASMYNSFQPRPTAWAPLVIRLFLFSVSVASSLGGCLIPLTYVGSMALLIALVFLVARPCRRPFDNILLALQLILGSTLAFSRSSDPELSVKLFYGVIGVTFLYVGHIVLMELLEAVSMSSLEMEKYSSETAIEDDAKKTNARRTSSLSKKITKKQQKNKTN